MSSTNNVLRNVLQILVLVDLNRIVIFSKDAHKHLMHLETGLHILPKFYMYLLLWCQEPCLLQKLILGVEELEFKNFRS